MRRNSAIICSFCSEFLEEDFGNLFKYKCSNSLFPNRIIYENDLFYLMPTIGAFSEGYILFVTKTHIPSMSYLAPSDLECLQNTINLFYSKIPLQYKNGFFFEHGEVLQSEYKSGCCEEHAHLHYCPVGFDIFSHLRKEFQFYDLESLKNLSEIKNSNIPYLLVGNQDGFHYAFVKNLESQYIRKIISYKIEIQEMWDWRIFPFTENMFRTYKNLKELFNE